MLSPGAGSSVAYTADDLAAILAPSQATRSLKGGGEPAAPGKPSSGVVPDLRINFASGKSTINPSAKAQLDELGRALQFPQLSSLTFVIAGHTDAAGSVEFEPAPVGAPRSGGGRLSGRELLDRAGPAAGRGLGREPSARSRKPTSGTNRRVEVRAQQ